MSASGHLRRRVRKRTMAQHQADVAAAEAVYIGPYTRAPGGWPHELWRRGGVDVVIPGLVEGLPPPVLDALQRRREAVLTGCCQCRSKLRRWPSEDTPAGRVTRATFSHAPGCPADDAALRAMLGAGPPPGDGDGDLR